IGTVRTSSAGTPHDLALVEAGGNLWYKDGTYSSEASLTTSWSPGQTSWTSLGHPSDTMVATGAEPVGVAGADGATNGSTVFVRGGNGATYTSTHDGTTWGPWKSLGGNTPNEPAVVTIPGSRALYVFVRGTGNDLWFKFRSDSMVWVPSE